MSNELHGQYSWTAGVLLMVSILVIDLVFLPSQVWPNDAAQWRYETLSLVEHGRLWIDAEAARRIGLRGQYFVLNPEDGRYYSKFGIVNSLMSAPPMVIERLMTGQYPFPESPNVLILDGWNLLLSLCLAAVLYCVTARYSTNPWHRMAYVFACFFCTFIWYYQRAQGGEIYQPFFFACFYECLLRGVEPGNSGKALKKRWLAAAWCFVGLLTLTRLLYAVLIPLVSASLCL
jgi:hypothetical protein